MKKQVVIKADTPQVNIRDISEFNIYAFKGNGNIIYKAHRLDTFDFAFVSCETSLSWANGSHKSLEELIKHTMQYGDTTVYEFENQEEFFKWALEEIEE